jgi:sulfur carrier protein
MSKIVVNGKEQEIEDPFLLTNLLKSNKVQQPDMVSIQVNGEFVDRKNFTTTRIKDGDEVDFLYIMGGA